MFTKSFVSLITILLFSLALVPSVFAQPTLTGSPITLDSLEGVVESVAQFLLFIGGIVAVIFIVWGGIKYMAARDNATEAANARKMILNGLIGAAIIFGVGTLLATAQYAINFLSSGTP